MFRTTRVASATLAVLVLSSFPGATTAHAAADTSPPAASGASLTPDSVDTSEASQTLTLTIDVTDDLSGFRSGYVLLASPSGKQTVYVGISSGQRSGGTALAGAYTVTASVPRYAEQGLWQAASASLSDETGNTTYLDRAALDAAGLAVSFTQAGAGDTTGPTASGSAEVLSPATVDTSAGPQTLTLTVDVSDDLAGLSYGSLSLRSPSGGQSISFQLGEWTRTSGTPQSGTYVSTAVLPQNAEPGVWEATDGWLQDAAGNSTHLDAAGMEAAGLAASFVQEGQGDTTAPVPTNLTVTPSTVDTSDAAQTMTVSVSVADEPSGFDYGYLYLSSPSGNQHLNLWVGASSLTDGTAQAGTYTSTATLPRYAEHGVWKAQYASFTDAAGNTAWFSGDSLASAGLAASFTQVGLTPPSAPAAPSATAGDAEVVLTWSAPANDGGTPITGYTVTAHAGGEVVRTVTTGDTAATLTGLTNGTAHTFTITATNSAGASAASSASAPVTPATTPGVPVVGTVTAGDGQASVAFTAPASDGGSAITSYVVTAVDVADPADGGQTGTGATSPITVAGLTNGASYTFTVTATNARGTSEPSAASDAVVPATVPGAPTEVVAAAGDGTATVTWTAPVDAGGSPITGYTVTAAPEAGAVTVDGTAATVTGLVNGTAYTFTVVATNAAGSSAASSASLAVTPEAPPVPTPTGDGYWLVAFDGEVHAFGEAGDFGSMAGLPLNEPIVGMAATPTGDGYWLVGSDGGIFAFGDAAFAGSTGAIPLNEPIVGMSSTPTGDGYWLVGSDGGIFAFGDAGFAGSTGGAPSGVPVVGMAASPTGDGYWLVTSDGAVHAFGDAGELGSLDGVALNGPIVGVGSTPSGDGYWLVGSDGGIFAFGDAGFFGSTSAMVLNGPITGVSPTPSGDGYWLVGSDGGIFAFGDAGFLGAVDGESIVAAASSS